MAAAATAAAVIELIRGLNDAGATIVVITHDNSIAEALPRQVAVLDGRILHDSATGAATPNSPARSEVER